MASMISKLAVLGITAIVLIMTFSAISVSSGDSESNVEPLNDEFFWDVDSRSGDKWSWDAEKGIFTMEDGLCFKGITIRGGDEHTQNRQTTIVIKGTVTTPGGDHSSAWIEAYTAVGDVIFCGGGTIISNSEEFKILTDGIPGDYTTRFDNVSLKYKNSGPCLTSTGRNIEFVNCEMIELITIMSFPIGTSGKITVENTNLNLTITEGVNIMVGAKGIFLPFAPEGNYAYTYLDGSTGDVFVNGETILILAKEPGAQFVIDSYVPPKSNITPFAIGFFIVLLAMVAVGSYCFSKK